jgi:Ferritin-like domain
MLSELFAGPLPKDACPPLKLNELRCDPDAVAQGAILPLLNTLQGVYLLPTTVRRLPRTLKSTAQEARRTSGEDELQENMKENNLTKSKNRRSFLRGSLAAGAAVIGASAITESKMFAQQSVPPLPQGDVAILRFLAAAELIEADLWTQYAELGGIGNNQPIEVDMNQTLNPYQMALSQLDTDGPQYIASNTLDEVSHANFLNAYLAYRGAPTVNFAQFTTLPGSTATGSSGMMRLTNLMNLNVDTSWFVRYRSTANPDLGALFQQAITLKNVNSIPRTTAELNDPNTNHLQAIANVAAFHFGTIEQGGTSLYAAMSQKVSDPEVLRITLGIGGDEIAHFLEWVDFAGNGVQAPVAPFTDSESGLTFPNFFSPLNPQLQPSLIFPVPFQFLPNLPTVSMIRPIGDEFGGAVAAVNSLTAMGLFTGQSQAFLNTLMQMAIAADSAQRSIISTI